MSLSGFRKNWLALEQKFSFIFAISCHCRHDDMLKLAFSTNIPICYIYTMCIDLIKTRYTLHMIIKYRWNLNANSVKLTQLTAGKGLV